MLNLPKAGRFLCVTALAASTALSGPLAALAQDSETPPPAIEEAPPEIPAEPEPVPAPEPEVAPESRAAPEPPATEPAPELPEIEEPPVLEQAPEAPEPLPDTPPAPEPATPPQAAPDSGPPPADARQGDPAELPADDGTQNDVSDAPTPALETPTGPAPAPAEPAPSAPTALAAEPVAPAAPATPEAVEPIPPSPPVPGAEPATPSAADPAAEAAPLAPPTAPVEPVAPVAPNAATPVAPGTPPAPPALPPGTAPEAVEPVQPSPSAPAAPAAPDAAAAPAAPQAVAPPPPPVAPPEPVAADIQTAPVAAGQVGANDAQVQRLAAPIEVQPITAVQGERIDAPPAVVLPPQAQVVERVGNRDILTIVGAGIAGAAAGAAASYFIRSDDNARLSRGSRDVEYERLPRGLSRETITRPNGVQIVTIENEYGDVIQRSRIASDGRETVLFYDPYAEDDQRPDYYADAGADLPPLQLAIPRDRYIVDVSEPDEELYYETIVAPPVETVERIYSLDEVRRSPRIREKVRRIDLNTIQFGFGSDQIDQSQVENLQALADAVKRVIDENPAEVFLLEGHTDAVGSNVANLALSDRRAEAVASALSEYFEIPAENLVTQGYGEEDLKVATQSANAENRRVTLRRITALVKPVETARAR